MKKVRKEFENFMNTFGEELLLCINEQGILLEGRQISYILDILIPEIEKYFKKLRLKKEIEKEIEKNIRGLKIVNKIIKLLPNFILNKIAKELEKLK